MISTVKMKNSSNKIKWFAQGYIVVKFKAVVQTSLTPESLYLNPIKIVKGERSDSSSIKKKKSTKH